MAHILLTDSLICDINQKVDAYIRILASGEIPQINLMAIRDLYVASAIKEITNRYNMRRVLARKHANELVDSVINYRVSLANK